MKIFSPVRDTIVDEGLLIVREAIINEGILIVREAIADEEPFIFL